MKYLKYIKEMNEIPIIWGIDIDGTINNFSEGYNTLYKMYFPDKEIIPVTDWYWYQKLDYNGEKPRKWFDAKKHEMLSISKPFPGAVEAIDKIYKYIKDNGMQLKIVSQQPNELSKVEAEKWLKKYGFIYDELIFAETSKSKWNNADIMVDDAEKVIIFAPENKVSIKVEQVWNEGVPSDLSIKDITKLTPVVVDTAIAKLKNKQQV